MSPLTMPLTVEALSGLPAGFTMRAPTPADVGAAVDLFSRCSLDLIGVTEFTVADIETEWQTPGLDLATDLRIVLDPDGRLVGYVEVWTLGELPVHPWVWARVDPDFEGLGIGTALMAWAEQRSRAVLDRLPPDLRVAMWAGTFQHHGPSHDLLSGLGMRQVRHSWMMKIEMESAPPAPTLPDGIALRTFAEQGDALAVYRAVQDSFQDHWGFVREPDEARGFTRWQHFAFAEKWHDPALWFLALDGDEIAAICLCRPSMSEDPQMGYVATLGVRRPWRRHGLGLALLHTAFGAFWARGQHAVALHVDAGSLTGATRLYERAGMHVARHFVTYEKELRPGREISTQEVAD